MPHSKQLRIGRFSEDQRIYLLTATVEMREPIFADFQFGRLVAAELRAAQVDGLVETLAWGAMPDHLHWLLVLHRGSLSELMRRGEGRRARQINSLAGRNGRLWHDGFHDHALRKEEDVLPVARYIVANPLRAGLVERVGDYPL